MDLGISVATAFSLPRSVGSIFGLIFASADPIGLEDIIRKLEISRGSASMGLNFLLKMGAIQAIPPPGGTRRTLYEPEMSLRRLLDGVLQATILPHLNGSTVKIDQLAASLEELSPEEQAVLGKRLSTLRSWQSKARTLAPIAARVLGKAPRK